MSELRYRVSGMDCGGCASKIENAVKRIEGVTTVQVSVTTGSLNVAHTGNAITPAEIEQKVTALGYKLTPVKTEQAHSNEHTHVEDGPWWQSHKAKMLLWYSVALSAAFIEVWALPGDTLEKLLFILAILVGLTPIAKRALSAAFSGSPFSIEMLMTVAAVGAIAIGQMEEAGVVILLFLIGELLEGVAATKARNSIKTLADLAPKTALLEKDGTTVSMPTEALEISNVILVRPGERIPADGEITSGESAINEAPVTGESMPKRKGVGEQVFAGTVNGEAALRITVTAKAADNTIARVIRLVEEAQESKAPTERFIDSFSRWYTPAIMLVAALTVIGPPLLANGNWQEWIYKGLALLLIGCPCALVISTPASVAAGLATGARRGLLLKGGTVLETLGKLKVIAFDKTGTLTEGKPNVTDILSFTLPQSDVLRFAAALETGSSHPLALAILARAKADGISVPQPTSSTAIGGKGIEGLVESKKIYLGSPKAAAALATVTAEQQAQITKLNGEGKTVSLLLVDGMLAGGIAMRDEPRADAIAAMQQVKALSIRPIMLTGDNKLTGEAIAAQLGMEVHAELLPEDKQRIVDELQQQGHLVGKVGDGINDAPALAKADVGIAMGGGTDVALETADAAALHARAMDIPHMVMLSRQTMQIIRQNIFIALGLKVVFLITTLLGITGLWPAILADTGATVLVTLNAMRLLRVKLGN